MSACAVLAASIAALAASILAWGTLPQLVIRATAATVAITKKNLFFIFFKFGSVIYFP
jgi:hypothetical protein